MLFKSVKSSGAGELFYTKAGIGRKGISLEGVRKNIELIKRLAAEARARKKEKESEKK